MHVAFVDLNMIIVTTKTKFAISRLLTSILIFFIYSKSLITSTNSKNAGSMLAYHPIWDKKKYEKHDKVFKESCCSYSTSMCESYYNITSSGDTANYAAPNAGMYFISVSWELARY